VRTTNLTHILYTEGSVLEEKNVNCNLTQSLLFTNVYYVIVSRRMRWVGHPACMGEGTGAYRILVGRPEGRRPLGRPGRRLDDIKVDLQEVGWGHGLD
jgi:hypothetical protein